jgi:hypothetical protein
MGERIFTERRLADRPVWRVYSQLDVQFGAVVLERLGELAPSATY